MKKFTITINQNINGKEKEITRFEFLDREMATQSFRSLKTACEIMSNNHYTVMRLFKNEIELAKFSWENGVNQAHTFKSSLINYTEVYDK